MIFMSFESQYATSYWLLIVTLVLSHRFQDMTSFPLKKNIFLPLSHARREPQRGPRKHSRGATKHFHGASLGKIFLNFSFQNGTFWRTLYLWPTTGLPNVAGPGVANPLPHLFDGPATSIQPQI